MRFSRCTRAMGRLVSVAILSGTPMANAIDWPQEIDANEATIVVYQPQPEGLDGNKLKARAAMQIELKDGREPVFGAFWFEATISTDKEAGIVNVDDLTVTNVRWPESKDAEEQRFTAIVEAAMPENGFETSLERLSASLESAEIQRKSLEEIKNDPPAIVFREELAVLLMYDGDPKYAEIENSNYERVLNTPFAVVRQIRGSTHWLYSGKFWYESNGALGPWSATNSPPSDLKEQLEKAAASDQPQPASPPSIVVATEPTELIVTQGSPEWQALESGEILFVENTESPWLRDLSTGNMYLLLSGRWFRSRTQEGPWTFVRADELPQSFQDIPPESPIGGIRTSVAGTDEAKEAVLESQVPQTAAIKRSEAKLTVEYDGDPEFEQIAGTKVSYAVNTGAQVLLIEGAYYAVDNGVWFTSRNAAGPWAVADSVPQNEIDKIPPSSPVYNTTYVHVYDSTPEVVYVGYTPGYMWSYPYYGVPIYGTGWYYPPYWGGFYYPRPPTWGFHVGYNPWTGWNFGLSWSNGFFSFGVAWGGGYGGYRPCCGGWYGGGYRGPTIINTGDINIGNNVNIGNRTDIGNRIDRNNIANNRQNIYNRPENRARNAAPAASNRAANLARPATNRANNVFADRSGNVARRTDAGWESRTSNGQWSGSDFNARARSNSRTSTSRNYDRSSLNRSYQSRQRGSAMQASRPRSMSRGGGMRRRR